MVAKEISGQRYGRLIVIERAGRDKRKYATWKCQCDCGNEVIKRSYYLRRAVKPSCGCWKKEMASRLHTKHGKRNTRLYEIWKAMKQRCSNPNHAKYEYYGGKGVEVCSEWQNDFQAFYDWAMANGYADNLTIDRIDNDKGYSPNNCRWETVKNQHNHTSANRYITYNGEIHTLAEWGEIVKIKPSTIYDRLSCGWSVERALTTRPKGEL